ncbi:hypothetical protein CBER1_00922 [Cercospora berteroae]|uniref:RING-type domain-containing protein n=1 Tax=Cercospora berteroae TaxID=357750 RepID=A0A2S6C0S9_9PEZI|nr:hypothetical protein CBER1_00922 [Cercospora berteroae]
MADSSETIECGVCCDDVGPGRWVFIGKDNDKICNDCFSSETVPKFQAALRTEGGWSECRWAEGESPLKARDYAAVLNAHLGADFVTRFEAKESEYRTPGHDRLYRQHPVSADGSAITSDAGIARIEKMIATNSRVARCGAFVGSKASLSSSPQAKCQNCSGNICLKCNGLPIYSQRQHKCVTTSSEPTAGEDAFAGLEVGKDFQYCPGCRSKYMLSDGCNSVFCRNGACGKSFCVLCGQEAAHNSKHWIAGNITGCSRFGKPGQGGTFGTVQTLQAQGAGSECVVLDIPDFREHFIQVYRESSVTQSLLLAGWCDDPKLSDEWIVVCLYNTGAGRGPFENAQVWFCEVKDGEERLYDGYQATDGLVSYFHHWPERLRETLLSAAAKTGFNTLSTDEAHNLRKVDVDIFRSTQHTLLKQDPDRVVHYMTIHLLKFDRLMADAPPLQRIEQIFLQDQHFFNACVFEYYEEFVHGREKHEYEDSYVYGAFTIHAHKACINSLREQADNKLKASGSSLAEPYWARNRHWIPDCLTALPDEAIVVVRYLRPGCSPKVAFARAQICGFDNNNGDLTEHYKNLRKLLWFREGSSRRYDSLLSLMLQREFGHSNLMWSIDPHARSTFVPTGALTNSSMHAYVSGIEMEYAESAQANVEICKQNHESRDRWRKRAEEGERRAAQLTADEVQKDLGKALEDIREEKLRVVDRAKALARGLEREREILLELFRQDEEATQLYGGDAVSRA